MTLCSSRTDPSLAWLNAMARSIAAYWKSAPRSIWGRESLDLG